MQAQTLKARGVAEHHNPETAARQARRDELILQYMPLIKSIAQRTVASQRAKGKYCFDAADIAQELVLRMPALIDRYNSKRGVTLGAYLKACLTWHVAEIVAQECNWRNVTSEYIEGQTIPAKESHGRQTRGAKKITLRAVRSAEDYLTDVLGPMETEECRLLDLRYWHGMKQREIAEMIHSTRLQVCRELAALEEKIKTAMNETPRLVSTVPEQDCQPSRSEHVPKFRRWMREYFFRVTAEIMPEHPMYGRFAEQRQRNRARIGKQNVTPIRSV